MWSKIKKALVALKDPKFAFSFLLAWLITNGWSYIFIAIPNPTLRKIGLGWQAILWLPFTVEKPITFAIAVWFRKIIFRKKEKIC